MSQAHPLATSFPLLAAAACAMTALALWQPRGNLQLADRPSRSETLERRSPELVSLAGDEVGARTRASAGSVAAPAAEVPPARRSAESSRARVRVHGRVLHNGVPVAGCDLSFVDLAEREADWDFTEADGSFEVYVPAGAYDVRHDEDGAALAEFDVAAGGGDHRLDIELAR